VKTLTHVFSLEIRKILSYRVDFWLQFAGGVGVQVLLAYFLWSSVFESRGITELGGYSFRGIMLYYLLAPLITRMICGMEHGSIAPEIYDGSLNRYLVYPVSFFGYKLAAHYALLVVAGAQIIVALTVFKLMFGIPPEAHLSILGAAMAFTTTLFSAVLYFFMVSCLELVAFWADNIWSLLVMLRFSTYFLGGAAVPLTLFPDWMQGVLYLLPFRFVVSFPEACLFGHVSWVEWLQSMLILGGWILVAWACAQFIWMRGTKQYSGVGI
jgi:ABC-2 type transport system permease protein